MRGRLLTLRAIRLLRKGQPIPLDLFADLHELGVNVEALSRRYGA